MRDWQVGDKAVCVHVGYFGGEKFGPYPEQGAVYKVIGTQWYGTRDFWLFLAGAPDNVDRAGRNCGPQWHADRFRKIRPDEHEACEPEFVTLLARTKRKVSA